MVTVSVFQPHFLWSLMNVIIYVLCIVSSNIEWEHLHEPLKSVLGDIEEPLEAVLLRA